MRPELQDIVDEVSRLLRADTTLEDRDFNLIAYGQQTSEVDTVRRDSILHRGSSRETRDWFEQFGISRSPVPLRTPADPERGMRARLCFPVRWRGVTYGYLWVLDEHTGLDDPAVGRVAELAEHAGSYLSQLSRQRYDQASTVADLISADAEKVDQAVHRLVDQGSLTPTTRVAAVVVTAHESPGPDLAPNLWGLPRSVLVDHSAASTLLLVPLPLTGGDEAAQRAAELAVELYRRDLPAEATDRVFAGIGAATSSPWGCRTSWVQARTAGRVASRVPAFGPVARWADLGLYRLLAALPTGELQSLVLDDPVRALLADPELVTTVASFLERAGNVQATAAALHIHRQTLYYRLGKAESRTGLSLANGHDRARLQLGLMLAPLLEG